MLTFCGSEENTCFKFIGSNNNQNSSTNLLSDNTSLISNTTSLISCSETSCADTCSFYAGPSDLTIMAFGESYESCGSIALGGTESCGSIAYSGSSESCGSIASSFSSSSSFSSCSTSSGCSYSC